MFLDSIAIAVQLVFPVIDTIVVDVEVDVVGYAVVVMVVDVCSWVSVFDLFSIIDAISVIVFVVGIQ